MNRNEVKVRASHIVDKVKVRARSTEGFKMKEKVLILVIITQRYNVKC